MIVFKTYNDKFYTITGNYEKDLVYIKENHNPHIYIKKDVLNSLHRIAFEFKLQFIKSKVTDNTIYVYSKHKNINTFINQINECMNIIDISNLPPNIATPKYMSQYVKKLFKNHRDVTVKILGPSEIKKQRLNLLYSIGDGNYNPPYFVIIERLKRNTPTTCVIGKGITFDSGGVSIKSGSANELYYMKLDKLGACYAIHAFKYIIENTSKSIVALLPFTDNMLSEKTLKPGDVIKSHNKKTIEIVDTDAEGRLVVADSLSYASKYNPSNIIDITTLTETHHTCSDYGVFFTKNNKIKNKIEKLSLKLNEPLNGLPSYIDKKYLYSTVADIKNLSINCSNDAYNAAMFLHEFVPLKSKWVHFDISNEIYTDDENLIPNTKGFLTISTLLHSM